MALYQHQRLSQIFEEVEGCEVIVDDLLVWGMNAEEHHQRLEKVLQRAVETDLRFNQQKCKFNQEEVRYVGHVFNQSGLKPSPDRVQSITDITSQCQMIKRVFKGLWEW